MFRYVVIPLLGINPHLDFYLFRSRFCVKGIPTTTFDLYCTSPVYGIIRLGSVIYFCRVPCLVVARAFGLSSFSWWKPFKRFSFIESEQCD